MKKLFTLLFVLIALNFNAFGQAVGDYGSSASGSWSTLANWIVCVTAGTWTGATAAGAVPTTAKNVWVRSGHTVTLDATGNSLSTTIESGGTLSMATTQTLNGNIFAYGTFTATGTINVTLTGNLTCSGAAASVKTNSNNTVIIGAVGKTFTLANGATFQTSKNGTNATTASPFTACVTNVTWVIDNSAALTTVIFKSSGNTFICNPPNSQVIGNLQLGTSSGAENKTFAFASNVSILGDLVIASSNTTNTGAGPTVWNLGAYIVTTSGIGKTVTVSQAISAVAVNVTATASSPFNGFSTYNFVPPSNANFLVNYSGTTQTIANGTYQHLTVGAGTKTLGGNTTVTGTLSLGTGIINTSTNSLALTSTGTLTRSSGYVIGTLTKNVAVGATSRTFEIGEGANYLPVTVAFGSVSTAGDLTVKSTAGSHANIASSGISSTKSLSRYWTLSNNGIVFDSYNSTFTFVPGDILGGATTSLFVGQSYNGSAWSSSYTMGTLTSTTSQVTGVTTFGDFILGETAAATPSIGASVPQLNFGYTALGGTSAEQSYTVTGSNLTSSVTVTPPTGFQISTGTGGSFISTNPITIVPSSGSVSQIIYVRFAPGTSAVFSDNITNVSSPVSANVLVTGSSTLAAEPTSASTAITFLNPSTTSITVGWTNGDGANHIVVMRAGSAPSANPSDGSTYTASSTFGSGTSLGSGYVVYNSTGSSVTVTGLAANSSYYVNVYELNGSAGTENYLTSSSLSSNHMTGIAAKATGLWSATGTWQGSAVPSSSGTDNVIIPNGYTVTVGGTAACNNLNVQTGGTLIASGTVGAAITLKIYGSTVTNNGTMGASDGSDGLRFDLYNSTVGTTFSGSGTSKLNKLIPVVLVPEVKLSNTNITLYYTATGYQLTASASAVIQKTTIDATSTLSVMNAFATASSVNNESAGSWIIDVYGTLNVSGTISLSTGSAFSGALNVKSGGTVNHLGGTFRPAIATSAIASIVVDGTLNFSATGSADFTTKSTALITGSGTVNLPAGATLTIGSADGISASGATGPIQSTTRVFDAGANFTYNGASAQITGSGLPSTVRNLTVNNSNGVTLSSGVTVTNSLALTSGLLNIGNNSITLGTAATVAGTPGTTAMVVTDGTGNFIKSIADAATLPLTFTFPIGETSGTTQYSPVAVTVTSATLASASISAKVVNTKHASNTSATDYINRYWTLSSAGITGASMSVTGTYLVADVAGTEGNLWTGQYNGSSWTKLNAVNATLHQISATAIASLGDFTAGESSAFVAGGFVNITLIPEGYYRSDVDPLPVSDVFTATLASATGPDYADVETANITIDANTYTGTATFTTAPSGDYYLYVKGIALMATWTAAPITFTQGSTVSYDFTDAVTKAYAIPGFPFDPMIQQGTKWTIYSGDVDQDELIGNVDLTMIDNDAFVTLEVHGATDLDGDALVGNVDLTICDNHAFWVVESQTPRKVGGMASKYLHKPVLKRTNSIQK